MDILTSKLTDEEKQLNELFTRFRDAKVPFESRWIENWLFYAGEQWKVFDQKRRSLRDWADDPELSKVLHFRVKSNRITQDVQRIVAFMMRVEPWIEVVPKTIESEDRAIAQVQTAVIQYVFQKNRFSDVRYRKFLTHYVAYGIGALFVGKKKLDEIIGWIDNQPVRDVDIGIDIISPFEFWVDPYIDEWDKHEHLFIGRKMTVEQAEAIFGRPIAPNYQEIHVLDMVTGMSPPQDIVLVIEYYRRPSKWHKGTYAVFLPNGEILKKTEWPFPHNKLPLVWGTYYHVPDCAYGLGGVVQNAKSLQKLLNFGYSLMLENLFLMGHGKILAPKGSIDANKVTNKPGEIIEYEVSGIGLRPEVVQGIGLPGSFHDMMNRIIMEYNENVQVAEVLRGVAPATDPAKKVQIKTIQASEVFVPSTAGLEFVLREAANMILALAKKLYSVKDQIRIVGRDMKPIIHKVNTAKWPDEADVAVKVGAQLPVSKQVMNQLQLEDAIARYRANPYDIEAQQIMEFYFQLAGVPFQSQRYIQDASLQKWEIEQMLEKKDVPVFEWHNHDVHLAVLYTILKSPEFYELDPVVQRLLLAHRDKHEEYRRQQMTQMTPEAIDQLSNMLTKSKRR